MSVRESRNLRASGRGVLIYWHVERKSMVIHSQVINCTASEVAAMVEGAMHHGTEMDVEANYTDTHGQSIIGFGLTRLLGFDLLPRIKAINRIRLYRPSPRDSYPQLAAAMVGRPIRWDLIADQYDQMIKYATAIRTRSAQTAAILRRFQQANAMHPTYQAMLETGRAQRTLFAARNLRDRDLQREINAGLNVAESWNAGNSIIYFGKGGDIPANRRDEQELSARCLRVLQVAVVYLNTLMIQDVLDEGLPELGADDLRGLTPLFWTNIAPYGEVRLNMSTRLALRDTPSSPPASDPARQRPRPPATPPARSSHDDDTRPRRRLYRDIPRPARHLPRRGSGRLRSGGRCRGLEACRASAARVQASALYLHHNVVRDALAGGLDWWAIGELLAMHPQAAFEEYANLADGTVTPAQQRPALAVTCTAGLAALHDMESWYGIDIDDLDSRHSLDTDPTVARLSSRAMTTWRTARRSAGGPPWPSIPMSWAGCARP